MSTRELTRYLVRGEGESFTIWDTRLKSSCGLPAEGGGHQELTFPTRINALDWLRLCEKQGLDVLGHPGITIRVYRAANGESVARHIRTVTAPPEDPLLFSRFPPCSCPRHRDRLL